MSENRRQQARRVAPRSAWQKGRSGNPGGRPKIAAEVRDLARVHTVDAIRTLVELMGPQHDDVIRHKAAESLLDRGYGKPMQAMEHSGPEGGPIEVKDGADRFLRSLASLAARLGADGVAGDPQ